MSAFEIGSKFERQCLVPANQLQTADATIRVQNLRTGSADSLRTSETIQLCIHAGNASRTIGYGSAKVSILRSESFRHWRLQTPARLSNLMSTAGCNQATHINIKSFETLLDSLQFKCVRTIARSCANFRARSSDLDERWPAPMSWLLA